MGIFDATSGKRKGYQLSKLKIREVSLVDHAACPGADVILAKSRDGDMSMQFEPILFQKAAEIDPDEIPGDLKLRKRIMKAYRKQLRKTLRRRFGKADRDYSSGQDGNGYHSESDRVGAQDARDDAAHADDTAAILAEILRSPPVHSENWTRYSLRVFGQAALNEFTSDELNAARSAFELCRGHLNLKVLAADALEKMAKARSAETGETFHKAYAEVAKTPEGQQFYGAMRTNGAALDLQRAARSVAAGPSNRRSQLNAPGMTPEQAMDAINKKADEFQAQMPGCKRAHALILAGQALPQLYEKSRQAQKI